MIFNLFSESNLRDTPCMKYFIMEAAEKAEQCFPALYNLQWLASTMTYGEISMMRTSDGQNSLKCRYKGLEASFD